MKVAISFREMRPVNVPNISGYISRSEMATLRKSRPRRWFGGVRTALRVLGSRTTDYDFFFLSFFATSSGRIFSVSAITAAIPFSSSPPSAKVCKALTFLPW